MNEQEKKRYLEQYKKEKEKGVPFFPDIIFKDVIASLLIFLILAALAYFVGVPTEARANPNDATYTPRPEWYFFFLFQLLKYFPGNLEVIGVMVIPGLFILLLFALPFIDRSPKRHFLNRPFASIIAFLVVGGIVTLTTLALREEPPPLPAVPVDQAAVLYSKNCANCHGPRIVVPAGIDLHKIIATGTHTGMPAWGGDLSTDEIDSLAGFITSSKGSTLFTKYCSGCHSKQMQAAGNLQELQRVIVEDLDYPPHKNQKIPDWKTTLTDTDTSTLLNFLAAPDGQRLFQINCSGCHGYGVAFTGTESQLSDLISKGGQHITMPAWQGTLSDPDLEKLANFVVDTSSNPAGKNLFDQHCSTCHGNKVPTAPDIETALKIIKSGGPHVTMPVWGNILTSEQLNALVKYTLAARKGTGALAGEQLFANYCSACHGQFGQGGPNPSRVGDMIVSISSSDFLKTRDDAVIRTIIKQGQPDSGMSPFGAENGGQLSDEKIDAIIAYIRNWESNPPRELPVQTPTPVVTPSSNTASTTATPIASSPSFEEQILPLFQSKCAACHASSIKFGGWDGSTYKSVMATGTNSPVIKPGDAAGSFLVQKILGMQGKIMPPSGPLSNEEILLIMNWISAGASQ